MLRRSPETRLADFLRGERGAGGDRTESAHSLACAEALGRRPPALATRRVAACPASPLSTIWPSRPLAVGLGGEDAAPPALHPDARRAPSEPAPRFVHVVREGLETVASLYAASKLWEKPYDLEACIRRWNREVELSLERVGRASPPLRRLRRARVGSPRGRDAAPHRKQLDLAWQPEMLERRADSRRQMDHRGRVVETDRGEGRAVEVAPGGF